MRFLLLFIILQSFYLAAEGSIRLAVDADADEEYFYVYLINESDRDVDVYENISINPCDFKNGLCLKDFSSNDALYIRHGGLVQKKMNLPPFTIYGYVVSKVFSPFVGDSLTKVPSKVVFVYYLPNGEAIYSGTCDFASKNDDFVVSCSDSLHNKTQEINGDKD